MELAKVISDINKRKTEIETKYNNVINQINKIREEIDQIPTKFHDRTKQFQNEKRNALLNRIEVLERNIEKWLNNQKTIVESKLSDFKDQVAKDAENYANNLINSKSNFL